MEEIANILPLTLGQSARINKYDNSLSIEVDYKGRNDIFYSKLHEVFKGSGIRGGT